MADSRCSRPATRYVRYERGTEVVVSWLVQTAGKVQRRCGVELSIGSPQNLPIQQLLDFAEAICDARPKVVVPAGIIAVAEDVISGRKDCADYHAGLEKRRPELERSKQNASHRHFIKILEDITGMLKGLVASEPVLEGVSKETPGRPVNIYEYLELF